MQERRHRPGDVLDDYCPRERRITDHAIVAMIDDEIRRTRCGICDAEHEYKEGKVPAPRRKTQPPALFTQVLDNLNGSTPKPPPSPAPHPVEDAREIELDEPMPVAVAAVASASASVREGGPVFAEAPVATVAARAVEENVADREGNDASEEREEPELAGGFRRSLIRATFPRPEGQAPPPRSAPEFTIQSLQNRRNNNQRNAGGQNKFRGGRRRPGGGGGMQDNIGPMRFRDHNHGQGQGQGQDGRPQGQNNGGGGRRRRGGKKNR
jgi:hypothetical protein